MKELKERISVLMADIEDPSLIMEDFDLDKNEVKTYLLNEAHYLLWDLFLEIEANENS